MLALSIFDEGYLRYVFSSPAALAGLAFTVWMLINAIRSQEWIWVAVIALLPVMGAFWYFFFVYRAAPVATRGFELPGAHHRKRIKELQAQIHHLDKAHHYSQLGDIYFQQGKLAQAESCYRSAMERDSQDIDTRAHLGQCLLRQKRAQEALPLLQGVCNENPKHDYGHSLMALAECLAALGDKAGSISVWQRVTENHSYPRARVQLAELYLADGRKDDARAQLQEVINDAPYAPAFQKKREKVWVRKARRLLKAAQ